MKIPEIRIFFSWLLYDNVSQDMFQKYSDGTGKMMSRDACFNRVREYGDEWMKYEQKILPALMEVTGLKFYRKAIDVACAPWVTPQSDPLLMNFYYDSDQFVDVLTHELCHILLTDNHIYADHSSDEWVNLAERWQKMFGVEDIVTAVHIPVHALCKYIAVDVLNEPSRVDRDMEDVQHNQPYVDSWKYVNDHDYKDIISQIKHDYVVLGQGQGA